MTIFLGYCEPPSEELKEYAASLYARRSEGIVIPRQDIGVGDWHPVANRCHENSLLLAEKDSSYVSIHGWLYFDLAGQMPFVRFAAHSIVQRAGGGLIDITPTGSSVALYPFIRSNLSDDEFADAIDQLIQIYGSSNCLDHRLAR